MMKYYSTVTVTRELAMVMTTFALIFLMSFFHIHYTCKNTQCFSKTPFRKLHDNVHNLIKRNKTKLKNVYPTLKFSSTHLFSKWNLNLRLMHVLPD